MLRCRKVSVHLRSSVDSTAETASGVLGRADAALLTVLHRREDVPIHHQFRFSARVTPDGILAVNLRRLLPNGTTVSLYRADFGRARPQDELDWTELLAEPLVRARRRLQL